jgi:outer membrane protein OmpA-like peptidoglycan-associated protein
MLKEQPSPATGPLPLRVRTERLLIGLGSGTKPNPAAIWRYRSPDRLVPTFQEEVELPELPMRFASALVKYRHLLLAPTVVSAIALPQIVSAFDATSGTGRIIVAQKEDPKKKKEQQQQPKSQPKGEPQQKAVQPQPKGVPKQERAVQPEPKFAPKREKAVQPEPKFAPKREKAVQPEPKFAPKREKAVQPEPKFAPKQEKAVQPEPKFAPKREKAVQPEPKFAPKQEKAVQPEPKFAPKQEKAVQPEPKFAPKQEPKAVQPQLAPTQDPKTVQPQPKFGPKQFDQKKDVQTLQPQTQPPLQPQTFGQPKAPAPAAQFGSVNEIKAKRQEQREGNRVIIREPGNRLIIRENNRLVIRHDEGARMRRWGDARFEVRGQERYTIVRRPGYEIVTITDSNGHMLRRFRRGPDGREYVLIDNRRRFGAGAAVVGGVVLLGLAMPLITIPRERYIVHVDRAPPVLLYETLAAPPLVPLERAYTLDEIRDNVELRARVRSVDVNTINFATGSWEVSPDQVPQLQALAEAMLKVISENPSTVLMLAGHTDAVGAAEDNLSLSDRRAEAVAEILTTNFNIPPENLVTQGYGEQHLRVQTDGPSRENRRVEVQNITGLMAGEGPPGGGPPGQPSGPPPG